MSRYAAHIRMPETIGAVISETRGDLDELNRGNARLNTAHDILTVLQNRQLCLTQLAVLRSIQAFLEAGGGSRGSFLVLDRNGKPIHDQLGEEWRYKLETTELRDRILQVQYDGQGDFKTWWVDVRPIPTDDFWFENVWADYVEGTVFGKR